MSDEYQLRKDIDRFNRLFHDLEKRLSDKLKNNVNSLVDIFERYYDQSEIDVKINNLSSLIEGLTQSLNNKANSDHSHDERYYTESEVDERISSLNTFTKIIVNASVDLYYNSFFVKIAVHQLSNAGSSYLPVTYTHNIPQAYAPSIGLNVPLYNMKNGTPYGFMRLNSQGVLEIIINKPTYNSSGGMTMYGGLMYIR